MQENDNSTKKILIADDNQDSRELVIKILSKEGYQLSEAVDGEDAFNQISLDKPELILMDISMPKINGYELSGIIKGSEVFNDIKIIALTAHAMKGDRDQALAAGCDGYITKPINVKEFAKTIKQFLQA